MTVITKKKEICLKGSQICSGIAIGSPFVFVFAEDEIPKYSIESKGIEAEIERYQKALQKSREELLSLQAQLEIDGAHEAVMILETHLQIMQDEMITVNIENEIRSKRKNAEYLFHLFIRNYEEKLSTLSDEMFREKIRDVQDIASRLLRHLRNSAKLSLAKIGISSVVFAKDLVPSDAAEANIKHVSAIVTEKGGKTSHAAIIARAKGIPYVSNIPISDIKLSSEDVVIVDGRSGEVIINPTCETLAKYRASQNNISKFFNELNTKGDLPAETVDGYTMRLSANIEVLDEIAEIHKYRADGIGLFRSEYICLNHKKFPNQEQQFEIYQRIVKSAKGLPVVIRTFDVGGDKLGEFLDVKEANPFLGCRAIRYMLLHQEIFRDQLRAILRASHYGQVKIMFPMVSGAFELLQAKKILYQEMEKLEKESIPFDKTIKVGCMIEIPSAAITCDEFAKHCDFLSIGTNDLVQYSLAVDRSNQTLSYLYNPTEPSVIRLIKMVIIEANRNGIPVSLCGELAADPKFTALLMGLGIHELSCNVRYIPFIKNAIRATHIVSAFELAETVLQMTTSQEILDRITKEFERVAPTGLFRS